MLKTGMSISQKLSQKLTMLSSYGNTTYKQTEKSKQTSQTLPLKIREKKLAKWCIWKYLQKKIFNNIKNDFKKLSKCKDLENEVVKLWYMKIVTIPVMSGGLGMTEKSIEKYLEKIPGSPSLAELQKIAPTGTAYILRKTLSM